MTAAGPFLRVAVPSPLHRFFDYRCPAGCGADRPEPGVRVQVPFGRGRAVGVVVAVTDHTDVPAPRLKRAERVLDEAPVLSPDILQLALWAADYYHHPPGEALATALPALLRQGRGVNGGAEVLWRPTTAGRAVEPASVVRRAPRQAAILARLQASHDGLSAGALQGDGPSPLPVLRALAARGWVERRRAPCAPGPTTEPSEPGHALSPDQRSAVDAINDSRGFQAFLLQGVTGSGKTEVYLQVIERCLTAGRQALVLVPEIGLTPQLVDRFRRRLPGPLAVLHSGLTDRQRLCAWEMARTGQALVVIGTRSAVFTPLAAPGVFIVDEEHDSSLKQQEGFRYSARDLAVMRARRASAPVLLGSATPALESLYNVRRGRYRLLGLPRRAGSGSLPRIEVLDVRHQPMEDHLSGALLARMGAHLEAGGQTLLFLNRRGYAPTLLCHDCGWVAHCHRCDAHLIFHQGAGVLRCHHCGSHQRVNVRCPDCASPDLRAVGSGTERIERALQHHFPDQPLVRIDRDTTRRRGELEERLAQARAGTSRILLGTQMIAKGHHFPDVSLVAILDADQGLFSADFRASERMAQMIVQVAGRAGRAGRPGQVVIQTHHPEHPLLQTLVSAGYPGFAEAALAERECAQLPPFASLALLRAEAPDREAPEGFLTEARALAETVQAAGVELWGPVPAPMERRAGRFRAQLLIQAPERAALHRLLDAWVARLETLRSARRVRWSLDVDPVDTL